MGKTINLIILLILILFLTPCSGQDCSIIDDHFDTYENALKVIKSSDYKFSDDCNTSKSSWIYEADFYSCDGKTGYLIIETKSKNYIHNGVPIGMWNKFKNADSFGKYYNQNLKGRYQLNL
jgi:hypothetical protein